MTRSHPRFPSLVGLLAVLFTLPIKSAAQDPWPIRVDVRLGAGYVSKGDVCDSYLPNVQAGLTLRTRGTLFVGAGAEVVRVWGDNCGQMERWEQYQGQTVQHSGSGDFQNSPRVRALAGYAYELSGLRWEFTAEGGMVRQRGGVIEGSWQPWAAGALAMRTPSGRGGQLEVGRHRIPKRYYDAFDYQTLIHAFHTWDPFWTLVFFLPVN